ncbi:MAG TPA: hypothetical protein VNA22_06490 [Pyrinomonadaceae bacterium]|nr:hypothetical protein [Pyrinomonadaceae bacterium]
MKFFRSLPLLLLISIIVTTSCSKDSVQPSSSTGALTANIAIEPGAPRPYDREMLALSGQATLNEFIRADVRSRLDEEPTSDTAGYYQEPDSSSSSSEQHQAETGASQPEEPQVGISEETNLNPAVTDAKFHWAKKSFGDVVKGKPGGDGVKAKTESNGVIVLYADENFYDINALMSFVEEGRNRIAANADLPANRIQVVFGGYRGIPQVELWVVAEGAAMPEFRAEDRSAGATEPEN